MTVRTARHPTRRQAAALLAAAGAVVAGGLVATSAGGSGATAGAGRTAAAQARDLRVTDTEPGNVARSDTTTVLYDGTGGRAGAGPPGSRPMTAQSIGGAVPAAIDQDATTSTTLDATRPPPSSTTSTTLGATRPPPSSTSTSTTTPSTTTPSTTVPSTSIPPGPGGDDDDREPPADGTDAPTGDDGPGPEGQLGGPTAPEGEAPAAEDDGGGSATATLTELLAVGDTATRGSVLYRADDEPIVALLSTTPLFRDLRAGVKDGADVQAIESELRALGYGGFTVDDRYDAATAAAVRDWEEDLGRSNPDGVVTVGEVQLIHEPTSVLEHQVAVGDLLEPGDAVLVLGAESRVVEADVEAVEQADWALGTEVSIDWGDGTTSAGTVTEVGRDVVDGQVGIVVALGDSTGAELPIGSRVELVRTVAERSGAVAVPVSAVVAGDDGPEVRVVGAGEDRHVPVELGIVDDGWVEITAGLEEGTEVRLPA